MMRLFTKMTNYIVATVKDWNFKQFQLCTPDLIGKWHLIKNKDELSIDVLRKLSPRYIFFPHWSWIVPKEIIEEFECVCFHMADVPYGRGGSPLQNLIIRGHKNTKLTALKMVEELDAGPFYMKAPMSLEGSAEDIFIRAAELSFKMITKIIELEPTPVEQFGDVFEFKRRTPKDSVLPFEGDQQKLYDFIRMLDADTYPKAFIEYGEFRLEFDSAKLESNNILRANVTISNREDV